MGELPSCSTGKPSLWQETIPCLENPGISPKNSNWDPKSQDGGLHPGIFSNHPRINFPKHRMNSNLPRMAAADPEIFSVCPGIFSRHPGIIGGFPRMIRVHPETNAPHPGMLAASPGARRPCFRMKCLHLTDGGLHPAQIPGNPRKIPSHPRMETAPNGLFLPPEPLGSLVCQNFLPRSRRGLLQSWQTPTHRQHRFTTCQQESSDSTQAGGSMKTIASIKRPSSRPCQAPPPRLSHLNDHQPWTSYPANAPPAASGCKT